MPKRYDKKTESDFYLQEDHTKRPKYSFKMRGTDKAGILKVGPLNKQ